MRRVAHQLARNERSAGHPEHLLVYDTETRNQPTPDEPVVTAELKYGFAIWKRLSRGTREEREFSTPDEFWDFVESRTKERDVLWVVAHNAKNFDLAVLEYESQLSARGWSIGGTPVLPTDGQGPLKVTATKGRRKIILADLANWYGTVPLERIGRSVGCAKTEFGSDEQKMAVLRAERGDPLWDTLVEYARQDVEVVLKAMESWVAFLREHDLGNFAVSLAGQALQAFRHRFMGDREIMLHNSERALELEREAYMGARVDCFRVGSYSGSFHVVDVNSEYPFVMREHKYPVRLIDFERGPSFRKVRRLLFQEDRAIIARVKIDTDRRPDLGERELAVVPAIWDGKLVYPTGRFTCTLCTGELAQALELDIVAEVERMAVYEQGFIFKEYVDFFFGLRRAAQERGDDTADALAKLFMNSLYGKFGQRNYEWETVPGLWLDEPGTAVIINSQTGKAEVWRRLGDLCQKRSEERQEGYNSFCAIAAHATSYARMVISQHRATCGLEHALYTDTDSLIVDDDGLGRLVAAQAIGKELGRLKVEESAQEVTITAPKNYRCGSKVRHKGRRKDAVPLGDGRYRQLQFRGLAGAFRARDPNHAVLSLIVKKADVPYAKGTVDPDGWTRPLRLDTWTEVDGWCTLVE